MEHILIPHKRADSLDKKTIHSLTERLKVKIELKGNEVTLEGEPYDEYNAKNVITAYGRGFDLEKAYKLLDEEYFFEQIDLSDMFRNKEQLARIKSRIIGREGKAKEYIESVSGADLAIFGSTVSAIGRIDEIKIAQSALRILLEGGTHKTAYKVMEKERRKQKGEVYA